MNEAEHAVSFRPQEPWPTENLTLSVSPALEDVSGNNFRDLLDQITDQ